MLHTVDITKIYLHTFFLAEFTEISKEAGEVSENLDVTGHVENEKNDIGLESENVDQTNLQFDKNSQCCPSLEPNQNETNFDENEACEESVKQVENEKNYIGLETENVDQNNSQFDENSQSCPMTSLEPSIDDSNENETNLNENEACKESEKQVENEKNDIDLETENVVKDNSQFDENSQCCPMTSLEPSIDDSSKNETNLDENEAEDIVVGEVSEMKKNDLGLETENVEQNNLQLDENSQCWNTSLEPEKDDSNQNETNEETSQGNSPQCLKFKIFSATQILREINFGNFKKSE